MAIYRPKRRGEKPDDAAHLHRESEGLPAPAASFTYAATLNQSLHMRGTRATSTGGRPCGSSDHAGSRTILKVLRQDRRPHLPKPLNLSGGARRAGLPRRRIFHSGQPRCQAEPLHLVGVPGLRSPLRRRARGPDTLHCCVRVTGFGRVGEARRRWLHCTSGGVYISRCW